MCVKARAGVVAALEEDHISEDVVSYSPRTFANYHRRVCGAGSPVAASMCRSKLETQECSRSETLINLMMYLRYSETDAATGWSAMAMQDSCKLVLLTSLLLYTARTMPPND